MEFDSVDAAVDMLLLAGGMLIARSGVPSLHLARSAPEFPMLVVLRLLAESHGIPLALRELAVSENKPDKIKLYSPPLATLGAVYARWYGGGGAVVPADIRPNESALAVWLASTLAKPRHLNGHGLELAGPVLSRGAVVPVVAAWAGVGIKARSWSVSGDYRIGLPAPAIEHLTDWLTDYIPRPVWRRV